MAEFLPEEIPVSESVSSFISVGSRDSTSTDRKFVQFPGTPYPTLDEGAFLSFATIATNGGHDGNFDPTPFILPAGTESLTNFAHRAVHLSVKIGKQITSGQYGTAPHHSYYSACSAGGIQGIAIASRYPEDSGSIITGSPAVDWTTFPELLTINFINMTAPPKPHLRWTLIVHDVTMSWSLQLRGYLSISAILRSLLPLIPFTTALIAAYIFMRLHYGIKYNQFGVISKGYQSVAKDDGVASIE